MLLVRAHHQAISKTGDHFFHQASGAAWPPLSCTSLDPYDKTMLRGDVLPAGLDLTLDEESAKIPHTVFLVDTAFLRCDRHRMPPTYRYRVSMCLTLHSVAA